MYIDSHCHITADDLYIRLDEVLKNMDRVSLAMIICTNEEEFQRALPIREKDPDRFRIAWGWYPGDVRDIDDSHYQSLQQAIDAEQIDCLGEIGLDYYWDTSFKEQQQEAFIRQMHMANQAGLPIAIHMREATKDTMDLLKQHARTNVIMHCFSGSVETMKECIQRGYYISLGGPVTFKNARHSVEVAKACPPERLLTETDSPYMAPVPFRGKQNEPMYVEYVAKKIAEIKNVPLEPLCAQIQSNFQNVFKKAEE